MLLPVDRRIWEPWGKADPARAKLGPAWHPLLCHVLDVMACAHHLLTRLSPARLQRYAAALNLCEEAALSWLLLVIGLHDLGKLTPPFQAKVPHRADALRALGLDFPAGRAPHGIMSACLVPRELERLGCPHRFARALALAVGAHHGDFATAERLLDLDDDLGLNAGREPLWDELRVCLVDTLVSLTKLAKAPAPSAPTTDAERNAMTADLAGLATVADWLGSNTDFFPYEPPPADAAAYWARALRRAEAAVHEVGFRRPPSPPVRSFEQLFGREPWPLHRAMGGILDEVHGGSLVIVEAPMGEGKTEAALLLYDAQAVRGVQGLYFALPTQATANQILGRVERYLQKSFPGQAQGLHLVHGGAGLSDRYEQLKQRAFTTKSVNGREGEGGEQGPMADAWFARSKRALLAPIGVGTVDQALLGVLRSRHHFLRLHGLSMKVFVVDEVHAYDTFTSEILACLCSWLRALGTTVVLLSATLASPQRGRLLRAYGVTSAPALTSYPRITVARDGQAQTTSFSARRPPVEITLEWKSETDLPMAVAAAVQSGGCVAWIVNTVSRAQAVYRQLSELQSSGVLPPGTELALLHARFPYAARQQRELAAEDAFGPPDRTGSRPSRAILVGTQVLEQSLDLDFDLMVTELAPVDLVMQRAGRLHRHDREGRPRGLESRRLWITLPEDHLAADGPRFGASAYVYDEAILLRSWLALAARSTIVLPHDIEPLVETVYAPTETDSQGATPAIAARLRLLNAERLSRERGDAANADRRELRDPEESNPFRDFAVRFDDEDPRVHQDLRAITRLGEESVSVIPVLVHDGRMSLMGDAERTMDELASELPFDQILRLARQALSISHKSIVRALLRVEPPMCFQRSGHLRHHRLLRLDRDGTALIGRTPLRLDPELGLVVGESNDEREAR